MNGDYIQLLNDCKNELEKINTWINKNPFDSNVRFLISYAVIKSCGTIESVLKSNLYDYLANNAVAETKSFLQKNIIESSFNPSTKQIKNLLDKINSIWANDFDLKIKGQQEKEDLNSLVSLRNDFSHGSQITISIGAVKRYFQSGWKVLEILDEMMK